MADDPQLTQQMADLRRQITQLNGASGIDAASQQNQLTAQYNALQRQLMTSRGQEVQNQQTQSTAKAEADAAAARQQMLGLGQSGISRLQGDSTDAMVRNYLQGQMGANTLDPNAQVFGSNLPSHTATTGSASRWNAAQSGAPRMIDEAAGPWNAQSMGAYNTQATDAAASGEAARNQIIRDAVLQSGGNASDPSLAGAYAESLGQRNNAQAQARNQVNMRATSENFGAQRQAQLANQGASMQNDQFNAANQQQANAGNASLAQQMSMANMSAQNQAGMFNTQNQMQGRLTDFNAQRQAQQYNQQTQSQAANQMGSYNNQRQNMLTDAERFQAGQLGQQRFSTGQPQTAQQQQFPSYQQFQSQGGSSGVTYAPGYFNNLTPQGGGASSGAINLNGRTGSGATTSSFGPTNTGTPIYQQASQYVKKPPTYQTPGIIPMSQLPQLPGIKQPLDYNARNY